MAKEMVVIKRKHVLFLTFPAFGHIIPLLELAKKTAKHHQVTMVVSQSRYDELLRRGLGSHQANLSLVKFDDGIVLDPNTSKSVPGLARVNRYVETLKPVIDRLLRTMPLRINGQTKYAENTDKSLIDQPVDIVIADHFLTSVTVPPCHELGVPCLVFCASNGSLSGSGQNVTENTPAVPDQEAQKMLSVVQDKPRFLESMKQFLLNTNRDIGQISGYIVNNFRECDNRCAEGLASQPKTKNVPVYSVGPLFPQEHEENSETTSKVKTWLAQQPQHSVLYVSFGSLAELEPEQLTIMGEALLSTGKPFIYVVTPAKQDFLPDKIRQQTASQVEMENPSFLILSWAPQKLILTHPATTVFLTHAGWNSTLEAITGGVPMVAWPMFADQHDNGRWLVEKGFGVLIPDTRMGASRLIPLTEITAALRQAEQCREAITRMSRVAAESTAENGSTNRDFLRLMQFDFSKN